MPKQTPPASVIHEMDHATSPDTLLPVQAAARASRRAFVAGLLAAGASAAWPVACWAEASEAALARIKRTGILRTGFIAGAAPYYNKSLLNGEWQGFCVDFAQSLAGFLGVKLSPVETTWGNSVLDLQSNKIDCMFGLSPTPQRMGMVGFSQPLIQNTFTLLSRKGFAPKTWEEADQPGIRIAVDIGSNQDNFATQILKKATVRRFDTSGDATLALQTGQVDAQLLVVLLSATVLSKVPSIGHIVVPQPASFAPTSIGVQKETDTGLLTQINQWLAKSRADGTIRKTVLDNMQKLSHIDPSAFPKEATF